MTKQLMKGNIAIAQAAINAGCDGYFGYPITPQSEIGEFMSEKMQELKRAYVCAESEVAAINMLLGACATGKKAMTSSSSCAIGLMQEGLSYIAADEIPAVIVSVMRAGPGQGYIYSSQGDYNQATVGGGNGDYKVIVLAPSNVQECADLTYKAFYLAQKYRNPVILLADGLLGQTMEPVVIGKYPYPEIDTTTWALSGAQNRNSRAIFSLEPNEENLISRNNALFDKYKKISDNEQIFEEFNTQDADIIVTCFGSLSRSVKSAIKECRKNGIKAGMLRPISLFPFPETKIAELSNTAKVFLNIEMNMGQMLKDVRLAVNGKVPVKFFNKPTGKSLEVEAIINEITKLAQSLKEEALCKH